ncbi:MAG: hypothetical protein K9J79_03725 [Desulfobacteraceae bacterium]|nr:hypothetical protein [Desulfobacteraceae bacterium]
MQQLTLEPFLGRNPACPHQWLCETQAYVPSGLACLDCGQLLLQYIPQSPEVLGYVSADWAWHHVHGRAWTTKAP